MSTVRSSSVILQKLAENIHPLRLWLFWLSALRVFQSLFFLVPSQHKFTASVHRPLSFYKKNNKKNIRGWFSHLLLFLSKDHLFAVRSHWSPQTSQAVQYSTCLNDCYQTAQAETQTRLCQIRIPEWGCDLANRQPSCFSTRSYQWDCSRNVSGVFFLDPWSLWRGLRIFQGPRPTKVPARYLHVNKPPLRNYSWCFCALPLQNLTANYAMATLSTPFARMLIITVSLSSFLPAPHFTLCIWNPGSPRNTSVFCHLPLSVILLWCGSCFISIPPKGSSSSWGC